MLQVWIKTPCSGGQKEEKNWCDRFSQIILLPPSSLWQQFSIDSLQVVLPVFPPVAKRSKRKAPVMSRHPRMIRVNELFFILSVCWSVSPLWRGWQAECYNKYKRRLKAAQAVIDQKRYLSNEMRKSNSEMYQCSVGGLQFAICNGQSYSQQPETQSR